MNYELAKELKEAGWPQKVYVGTTFYPDLSSNERVWDTDEEPVYDFNLNGSDSCVTPTLSELIEACGEDFGELGRNIGGDYYAAGKYGVEVNGSTTEEAIARLWLTLNSEKS